jgi:hypothetical protein
MNRGVREHGLRKRIEWKDFLEENRKLVQIYDDHPEIDNTRIDIGEKEDYSLVFTRQKPTLVRGGHRGTIYHRRAPLCRGNPVEKPPDKPIEFLSLMGRGRRLLLSVKEGE